MINPAKTPDQAECSWMANDGTRIAARCWTVPNATAVVLITHGLGDHGQRFEKVARTLCANGFSVLIPDLRGHGLSEGQRGYSRRFDDFLDDMDQSIQELHSRFPSLPVIGYGQSFGGLLVLYHALRRQPPLRAIVASSPAIRIAIQAPAWKVAVGRTAGTLFPRISLRAGLDLGELSDVPDHESRARSDKLLHGRITPRTYFGMVDAGRYCLENAANLTTQALIMHGELDTITDAAATRDFASQAPGCDFKIWPDGKHELHQMAFGDEVIGFATNWMAKCLGRL